MDSQLLFERDLQLNNNLFKACNDKRSENYVYISENKNGVSYIDDHKKADRFYLKVINRKPPVCFLAFDNCYANGLTNFTGKRCDCLLFTDKDLLFAELKFDVSSKRRSTTNLKEGREQLSNTINYFYNNFNKRFISFHRFAIVVIPKQFYPKSQARLFKIKKEFYDSNYNVEYIEDTEFAFTID